MQLIPGLLALSLIAMHGLQPAASQTMHNPCTHKRSATNETTTEAITSIVAIRAISNLDSSLVC